MKNNRSRTPFGTLFLSVLLTAVPAVAAEPAAATGELHGCVHADEPLPAPLTGAAIAVTQRPVVFHKLGFDGACFSIALPKGVYLVRASAPGWTAQAPLVRLDAQAQSDMKLIRENGANPELAAQIAAMAQADQDARRHFDLSDQASMKKMEEVDKRNQASLRRILDTYGWPSAELVGYQGVDNVWLLTQHASYELMKAMLEPMRAAAERGELSPSKVALTIDRVLINEGKRQLYGSQFTQTLSGGLEVQPIEDPDHLDERRAQMGMEPFEQYRARALSTNQPAKKP